jgi:hypothetical protein
MKLSRLWGVFARVVAVLADCNRNWQQVGVGFAEVNSEQLND